MKDFWYENRGLIGKLLLNQFGAAFFGVMLCLPTLKATNLQNGLMIGGSLLSVIFYLFLIYTTIWEKGGHDRIKVDGGRASKKLLTGLWIGIFANIPNIIVAIMILVSDPFRKTMDWAGSVNAIGRAISLLWEGMYTGIMVVFAPENPWAHLFIVLPALIVSTVAYLMGHANFRVFGTAASKKKK